MPTLRRYSGIKACEDFVQRCNVNNSSSGTNKYIEVREYKDTSGNVYNKLACGVYTSWSGNYGNLNSNLHYLSFDSCFASTDDYDSTDYNGTSTGTTIFTRGTNTAGISYQITFTANESATVKCFKFVKNITETYDNNGTALKHNVLMCAIYLDEPLSVTAGRVYNISINFTYDDQQVTII